MVLILWDLDKETKSLKQNAISKPWTLESKCINNSYIVIKEVAYWAKVLSHTNSTLDTFLLNLQSKESQNYYFLFYFRIQTYELVFVFTTISSSWNTVHQQFLTPSRQENYKNYSVPLQIWSLEKETYILFCIAQGANDLKRKKNQHCYTYLVQ